VKVAILIQIISMIDLSFLMLFFGKLE